MITHSIPCSMMRIYLKVPKKIGHNVFLPEVNKRGMMGMHTLTQVGGWVTHTVAIVAASGGGPVWSWVLGREQVLREVRMWEGKEGE